MSNQLAEALQHIALCLSQGDHGGARWTAEEALAAHEAAKPEPVAWLHPANASCVTTNPTANVPADPCLVLWKAMNAAGKVGNRTDDKLIVKFLREAGYCIAATPSTSTGDEAMKFSELLTEYLSLREEATTDLDWTPIARRSDRREQMQWLLEQMDALVGEKEPT